MNGIKEGSSLEKTPVFRIDGGDLYYLAKHLYKLSFNNLSPFSGQPEGGSQPSTDTLALSKDGELKQIAAVLANPDLRIAVRRGGVNVPLTATTTYFKKERGKTFIVKLQEEQENLAALLFTDIDAYAEYFAAEHVETVTTPPVNLIKPTLSLESLILILNLADCYRRAYFNGLLDHSQDLAEAVLEEDFLTNLEQELQSGDIRWLLPSIFRLVPGLNDLKLKFHKEHFAEAESLNFISRVISPEDKRVLYLFGPSGKYLGLEFSLFWQQAAGLEITGLAGDGKTENLGRYYLAPTKEANHLFSISTPAGAEASIEHLALTALEMREHFSKICADHLDRFSPPKAKDNPAKLKALTAYCTGCGKKLASGASFCTNCGKKIG